MCVSGYAGEKTLGSFASVSPTAELPGNGGSLSGLVESRRRPPRKVETRGKSRWPGTFALKGKTLNLQQSWKILEFSEPFNIANNPGIDGAIDCRGPSCTELPGAAPTTTVLLAKHPPRETARPQKFDPTDAKEVLRNFR